MQVVVRLAFILKKLSMLLIHQEIRRTEVHVEWAAGGGLCDSLARLDGHYCKIEGVAMTYELSGFRVRWEEDVLAITPVT